MSIGIRSYSNLSREDWMREAEKMASATAAQKLSQSYDHGQEEQAKTVVSQEQPVAAIQRPNAPLEDFQLEFSTTPDLSERKSEGGLRSLDVEKAISDMKKDQVLTEYQYFVGSMRKQVSEDGTVIQKS